MRHAWHVEAWYDHSFNARVLLAPLSTHTLHNRSVQVTTTEDLVTTQDARVATPKEPGVATAVNAVTPCEPVNRARPLRRATEGEQPLPSDVTWDPYL